MQMTLDFSTHTILITASTWCQCRLGAGQFLLDLRLCSTNLIIDTVFLVISKLPRFVELYNVSLMPFLEVVNQNSRVLAVP